jgi:ADP-ribosylglycohydrolase
MNGLSFSERSIGIYTEVAIGFLASQWQFGARSKASMLIRKDRLVEVLHQVLAQRLKQGCDLDAGAYRRRIDAAADSYDAMFNIALELRSPPMRDDWPYREPLSWEEIVEESPRLDPGRRWPAPDLSKAAENVRAAFLGSVCGCMLGKPIEVDPSLAELRRAGEKTGNWPIRDYISGDFLSELGRCHASAAKSTRGNIQFVAADDDIHYKIIGMLLLEEWGLDFNHEHLYEIWSTNLPPGWTWGAERTALLITGINTHHVLSPCEIRECRDVLLLNPGDDMCGALIRADAYGYACPGNPDLAAWLAWKDASFTHIKTGVYGAMFVAALIALSLTADSGLKGNERLEIVREALQLVPAETRFSAIVRDSLEKVSAAPDWISGYEAVHGKYQMYTHCSIYQEIGTVINTFKFAESVDHGFCLQVSQGNDTDSFGAISGSILGCFFGPGYLGDRWLAPFDNTIRLALADFGENDLSAVADRMCRLPFRTHAEFTSKGILQGKI